MLELITGIVVAVVAIGVVLEPLLRADSRRGVWSHVPDVADDFVDLEDSDSPTSQALLALREIEFDKATGKLSEADYASLKHKYEESAVSAIRDERASSPSEEDGDAAEAMIARAKSKRLTVCPTCQHALETGSIFCSSCGRSLVVENAPMRGWMCGADLPGGAKYCAECGTMLDQSASG